LLENWTYSRECRLNEEGRKRRSEQEKNDNRKHFKNTVSHVDTNKDDVSNYSCLKAEILVQNESIIAIIDTGASISVVNNKFVERNQLDKICEMDDSHLEEIYNQEA
jgi:hypothetical protein